MGNDGVPEHFCAPIRDWMDIAYCDHWIEREDPVLPPPGSPDHTPLDFFSYGVISRHWCMEAVTCCLYFDGHRAAATCVFIHSTARSYLSRYSEHLEHLSL
ncbi:hypothetical protein TNCV_1369591 [Trichonephila clavipes]|nr:hypothetical protein TNCV_1369591 [Trichonephila clavipes]